MKNGCQKVIQHAERHRRTPRPTAISGKAMRAWVVGFDWGRFNASRRQILPILVVEKPKITEQAKKDVQRCFWKRKPFLQSSVSSCRARPRFSARRMPDATEPYPCNVCLWPLCSGGCGAERPRETRCRVTKMAEWYCSQCKPESKRFCYVTSCFNYGLVPSVGTFV